MHPPEPERPFFHHWWETRTFVALLILLAAVPLLYPPDPPLVDLPGHMGRFRVALGLASSPDLQRYYDYHWALIGNLGLDLAIIPMERLFGLELSTKLIVMAIPMLTVAGFLWVAREVHHRLPPTALFALPFAYGHPFLFGFVNFALSMALGLLAFGLWLRLARLGQTRLRGLLFVPISIVIWATHTYGWGLLGLLAFSAESVRQHDRGRSWFMAAAHGAMHASALAVPVFLTLYWQNGESSLTHGWFHFDQKWRWVAAALRDRWEYYDKASLTVVVALIVGVALHPRLTFSRNLFFSALVLSCVYLLLPRIIFASAFADMRLVPYIFAVVLLSVRFTHETHVPTARMLAFAGLAFLLMRLGGNTLSLALASQDEQRELAALDFVPTGARVLFLDTWGCGTPWPLPRKSQLGAFALIRRDALINSVWRSPGAQILSPRNQDKLGWFGGDPSQLVLPDRCGNREHWPISRALASFPRDQFDYVWLVDMPRLDPALVAGWPLLFRNDNSMLFRVRPG